MAPPTSSPARNEPCPCGSGLKYKRCCGRMEAAAQAEKATATASVVSSKPSTSGTGMLSKVVMGFVALMVVLFIAAMVLGSRQNEPAPTVIQTTAEAPAPWYYDAVLNRHWHPGHAHWHNGPPPPLDQRDAEATAAAPANAPAPWFFDVANNQHWHPEHGHWHPGPPPPEAER